MNKYIISEKAKSDLIEIADYTNKKWSAIQAEKYIRMILSQCAKLVDNPLVGRSYDHFRKGIRGFSCGKHIIFYRVLSKSQVRIVRILHEKMNIINHL